MSTEEFIKEIYDDHKEDIDDILELLKILKDLQKDEQQVYEISVTSNL